MKKLTYKAVCPGSCGELFQLVHNNQEWLLTYNIDLKTTINITTSEDNIGLKFLPKLNAAREYLLPNQYIAVEKQSNIPIGKGCSSSSADLLAGMVAMSDLKREHFSVENLTKLATKIEPTDSVGFSQWTVINPLDGEIFEQFNMTPQLYVYMLEPVESIDTVTLPRMISSNEYDKKKSNEIFLKMIDALRSQNLKQIGEFATQSALLNDRRLPKPYLLDIVSFARNNQLLGVNIAHSGTVVGLLLNEGQKQNIIQLEKSIRNQSFAKYYQKRRLCHIIYEGVHIV